MIFLSSFKFKPMALAIGGVLLLSAAAYAEEVWTLENSIKQVLKASPTVRSADAEVTVRKAELGQATLWPNPELGFSGSEKLGINDQAGGSDLTQMAISQPIPLVRLPREARQAEAKFRMQQELMREILLRQEYQASISFAELQFRAAAYELAKGQLEFASSYQGDNKGSQKNDPLVRYLPPLEAKRLDIIRASAAQAVASSEGEYAEALSNFNALLRLPHDTESKTAPLEPAQRKETLEYLLTFQEKNHPAIAALKHQAEADKAGISIAYGELFPDPVLTFFREKDFINDERQNFYGVTLNFQVPIWDLKGKSIAKAKAHVEKSKYDLQALAQELEAKLRESHLHLGHLIEQAESYRLEILNPSKEVFELTRNGFTSGEMNVLSLIDANNIYLEARMRYLELLYEAWLELAEMRLATGIFTINDGGKS